MGIFFPDQRWTSEGEPELGVGVVTEISKSRVQIHFPISGETRLYAMENGPLRRVLFKPGDTIMDAGNRPMLIEGLEEKNHLITYYGQGRTLSEADLGDVSFKHGVDDQLLMGDVDTPAVFALRRKTLLFDHRRRISPVSGYVGGRIDLIPHQLYIAHEVSKRYAPRVLLSDQVGLGKTIEACLILHRLLLSGRISRVLILVPDSLVHQWFVEMLRRFNLWFHIFNAEHCAAIEDGAPDGNPFMDSQLILCSTSFLSGSELRARQALRAGWDMLVVDEAHHLEWSLDKASSEYSVVELLSKAVKGLLLLTATPEQLGEESHFARLRLLDPDRYTSFDSFKNESLDQKEIADVIENLAEGSETVRNNLIEDLLDQHGPGRVIFRNTRSAMKGFPKRKAHLIPLEAGDDPEFWLGRMSKEFFWDMGTSVAHAVLQNNGFTEDPRVKWIVRTMKELSPAKVVLICRTKEKVLALEMALARRANLKVAVFHEDLTIIQRDRNAAWFSEPEGARLLICSEIGSEGRNFQFAHHLILFDLPFHPELLEQRIGRLDRIGQSEDIHIYLPYIIGSPQEVLVRWFHEGLNAFGENMEGGNRIEQVFRDRLLNTCLSVSSANNGKELELLIADTAVYQQELKTLLAMGRDRLLEMNSFRPEIADLLVKEIRAEDIDMSLENYMTRVFDQFGVDMEDLSPRSYLLHPSRTGIEAFPSIPDVGISITFDRKRALSREEVSFITWDHPMVTGAMDMVLSTGSGSASFGVLPGKGSPAILLELLFVLETAGEQNIYVDRFLPNTPLRVVVDHSGKELTDLFPVEILEQKLIPGQIDELIQNETLRESIIPNMIAAATKIAESLGVTEISGGLYRMSSTLDHEIDRLKSLQKKNKHIRPEEISIALEEKASLVTLIKNARIRLDALQLIRKGHF